MTENVLEVAEGFMSTTQKHPMRRSSSIRQRTLSTGEQSELTDAIGWCWWSLRECVEEPDGCSLQDEIQYRELALEEGRIHLPGGAGLVFEQAEPTVDGEYHLSRKERTTGTKSLSPLSVLRTTSHYR